MKRFNRLVLASFLGSLVLGSLVSASFFFAFSTDANQETAVIEDLPEGAPTLPEILGVVSNLALLPEGESPIVLFIGDTDVYTNIDLFSDAVEGDIALLYVRAGKGYLYRPAEEKLVSIRPVSKDFGTSLQQ